MNGPIRAELRSFHAFTLIELLVVIAIITVLMAISLTSLQAARDRAKRIVCAANLQQIGRGIVAYSTDDDRLPIPGMPRFHPVTGERFMLSGGWSNSSRCTVYQVTVSNPEAEPKKRWAAANLGFLHKTKTIEAADVLYCPSARKGWRYKDHAKEYTWPFERSTRPPIPTEFLRASYCYTPQSTRREIYGTDDYVYEAAFKLSTLNNRAVLALDELVYDENRYWMNMHLGPGGRLGGFNMLYGDGSVRFRVTKDSEKEYWEDNVRMTAGAFRHLLYLYSQ